jgi:S-adenosylmethionine decarboxylase
MRGLQLTADLHGCAPSHACMTDVDALRALCLDAVQAAGLEPVREIFHRFEPAHAQAPAGITGVVLLAESHLAVHTWPELGAVTLDVYVCNLGADHAAQAEAVMARLLALFGPAQIERHRLLRGELPLPAPTVTVR